MGGRREFLSGSHVYGTYAYAAHLLRNRMQTSLCRPTINRTDAPSVLLARLPISPVRPTGDRAAVRTFTRETVRPWARAR
eukprot:4846978-Pleurochrysis_carterae.AAC.1